MENSMAKTTLKRVGLVLVLLAVYLVVAVPFKVMSIIPGFTDVRPVTLLEPVYGIFFGLPGCIAFAVGNLIGDIISGSLKWSSIAGFASAFLGPFIYWFFWNKISKTSFSLRTGKELLKQTLLTLFAAVFEATLLVLTVETAYHEVNGHLFVLTVLINETLYPIFLGIPLMILMQEELGFQPKKRFVNQKQP